MFRSSLGPSSGSFFRAWLKLFTWLFAPRCGCSQCWQHINCNNAHSCCVFVCVLWRYGLYHTSTARTRQHNKWYHKVNSAKTIVTTRSPDNTPPHRTTPPGKPPLGWNTGNTIEEAPTNQRKQDWIKKANRRSTEQYLMFLVPCISVGKCSAQVM
jgi:hypothetical protein